MTFKLLLDKYRKDLMNMYRFKDTVEQQEYWREKSNETYNRLIEMYKQAQKMN